MSVMGNVSDKDLIDEIRRRGYRVAKADCIRTASAEGVYPVSDIIRYGKEEGFVDRINRDVGMRLGLFLIQSGAIPVIEEIVDRDTRRYRAYATVVVTDPQFDWPYPLKMEG
jgi:hypothetical protein